MVNQQDIKALQICVQLAREALAAGDAPFGSILAASDGQVLKQERNRTVTGENGDFKADAILHPEFVLARWAQANLTSQERATSTVYTSGEHCAMCAAAHAYVGLGRIVYASSTTQLVTWMAELGVTRHTIRQLSINEVAPNIPTGGPVAGLDEEVKELHQQHRAGLRSAKS